MLRTHTTSLSIVLVSARLTTTIGSAVSRWANVRGGNVTLNTGSLRGAGHNSYYWSATTYPNATDAYYIHFSSTNVNQSGYNSRFYGFSVHQITILTNNTAASPLYYVRGGYVGLDAGALRNAAYDSAYWSSTTCPNPANSYNLDFGTTNIYTSDHDIRLYGFSVRDKTERKKKKMEPCVGSAPTTCRLQGGCSTN